MILCKNTEKNNTENACKMLKNGKIYTERQESSLEALAWSLGTSMQRLENYKVSPRYLQRFSLFSSDNEVILRVIAQ